jgi:hypothetical protein
MNREIAKGLSQVLRDALEPLLQEIESLNERIAEYDRRIEQIAKEAHPEVALLQQGSRNTDCNAQLAPSENRSTKSADGRMATEAAGSN